MTRLAGAALPAGLSVGEGMAPDVKRFQVEPGDWVVLISDGVTAQEEDGWLRERLAGGGEQSPRELARGILEESGRTVGTADDQTVLAVRLDKRE